MEVQIYKLIRDGMAAASRQDYATALGKIRESIKVEQRLSQHRNANGMADQINHELRLCVWMHLAQIQTLANQADQALAVYEKLVKTAEGQTFAQIRFLMGNILHNQGQYQKALKNYRMALDHTPTEYPRLRQKIASNMAHSFIKLHKWQDAVDRIEENLLVSYSLASSSPSEPEKQNIYAMITRFDPLYTALIGYYALGSQEKMLDTYSRLIDASILISDHPDTIDIGDNPSMMAGKQNLMADAELYHLTSDDELDDLSKCNASLRHEHTNRILTSARLLAPMIAWEETQGYVRLIEILRVKGHHSLSLQVQMSMALTLLKKNNFEEATEVMCRVDREGLESALALGINVPATILQRTSNLSLEATAAVATNQEGDLHLLGIDPSVLGTNAAGGQSSQSSRADAGLLDMKHEETDTKKQPYATFVPRGVHTNISFIYYLKGDFETSARHAQIALEIDPNDAYAHINLGCTYAKLGQWDQALREFLRAQDINGDKVQATYNAGLVHHRQQNYQDAYENFRRVLLRIPNYGDAMYMAADCLARMARIDESIDQLNKLMTLYQTLHAQDPSVLVRLGELYALSGDEGQAAHQFKEAHRLVPFDLQIINWLGAHYVRNELYEQARTCFERASRVDTTTPKWLLMSAACLRKAKQYRDAALEYKRILRRFPTNIDALKNVVLSLNSIGQHREADEWAEKLSRLTNGSATETLNSADATDTALDAMAKQPQSRGATPLYGIRGPSSNREIVADKPTTGPDNLFGDDDVACEFLADQ